LDNLLTQGSELPLLTLGYVIAPLQGCTHLAQFSLDTNVYLLSEESIASMEGISSPLVERFSLPAAEMACAMAGR
jgi:hypothetical protein